MPRWLLVRWDNTVRKPLDEDWSLVKYLKWIAYL
jgi:hypothetical protein